MFSGLRASMILSAFIGGLFSISDLAKAVTVEEFASCQTRLHNYGGLEPSAASQYCSIRADRAFTNCVVSLHAYGGSEPNAAAQHCLEVLNSAPEQPPVPAEKTISRNFNPNTQEFSSEFSLSVDRGTKVDESQSEGKTGATIVKKGRVRETVTRNFILVVKSELLPLENESFNVTFDGIEVNVSALGMQTKLKPQRVPLYQYAVSKQVNPAGQTVIQLTAKRRLNWPMPDAPVLNINLQRALFGTTRIALEYSDRLCPSIVSFPEKYASLGSVSQVDVFLRGDDGKSVYSTRMVLDCAKMSSMSVFAEVPNAGYFGDYVVHYVVTRPGSRVYSEKVYSENKELFQVR